MELGAIDFRFEVLTRQHFTALNMSCNRVLVWLEQSDRQRDWRLQCQDQLTLILTRVRFICAADGPAVTANTLLSARTTVSPASSFLESATFYANELVLEIVTDRTTVDATTHWSYQG